MTPTTDASLPTWQQGWLSSAQHLPSPNFGPRPEGVDISLAVVHSISLPPGAYGTGCVQQLFTNQLDWDAHPSLSRHSRAAGICPLFHHAPRRGVAVCQLRRSRVARRHITVVRA